jgi:hypothetical protein
MLSIINAQYQNEYKILIEFSNNKSGIANLKEFIFNTKIKPFKKLQNIKEFQKFKIDYTIKWDDDLDLAPEYLYFETFKNDKSLQEQFKKWGYTE